jgi:glycosyltransferase involved in cell wall biosynthesis
LSGHTRTIQTFFNDNNINGVILETTNERYGLGAAINIGVEHALTLSDIFFVIENDFYLKDNLKLKHIIDSLNNTPIGFISFKHINSFNNVSLYKFDDPNNNVSYVIKFQNKNNMESFTVEFGCFICHKRFFDIMGKIIENEPPPITENTFIKTYNKFSNDDLVKYKILSGNELNLLHTQLNDEKCVFYHIGKYSSNGGVWKIPPHLEHLSQNIGMN